MDPDADDGTLSGLPWASVFDPATNVRALGEIQRRGLRAAGEVVERMVKSVDGEQPAEPPTFGAEPPDSRTDLEQVLSAWSTLVRQLMESVGRSERDDSPCEPSLDLGAGSAQGTIALAVTAGDGAPTTAVVWLHNRTSLDAGTVELVPTDLVSHEGGVIDRQLVRFDPDGPVPLPARSSRGITVGVDLPVESAAGHYRGTLLARDRPELWLPMTLTLDRARSA